jgi:serine/threonine-protein kinase
MTASDDNALPNIPGWEIVDVLGRGGMGAVYRARARSLSTHVALKVIDPAYAGQPAFRRCFMREISTAVTLHHPHILPILNFSPDPEAGPLYFVTPIVGEEGRRSLADLIDAEGRLEPALAASLLAQVADALAYAHSLDNPLIHRDVTPSNILLKTSRSGSWHALLADFGIAFPASTEAREAVTDPDSLVPAAGKPQYMAPEQFDDVEFGPITPHTDLYQLGVVAHECLTGELPYQETNAVRLSDCHRRSPVPTLTPEQCPDPRWRRLVAELLAKKPQDRPESAADVRNRLFDIARQPRPEVEEDAAQSAAPAAVPPIEGAPPTEASPDQQAPPDSPERQAPAAPQTEAVIPPPPAATGPAEPPASPPEAQAEPAKREAEPPAPPRESKPRRVTPPTVVQTPRAAAESPAAPQPSERRPLRIGRWVLLVLGLALPVAVLALQFRSELFGPAAPPDEPPLVQDDPDVIVPPVVDPGEAEPNGDEGPATPDDDTADDDQPQQPEQPPTGEDAAVDDDAAPADDTGKPPADTPADDEPAKPDDGSADADEPFVDPDANVEPEETPIDESGVPTPPATYEPGPNQQAFLDSYVAALQEAGLSDAQIDAVAENAWRLPEDLGLDRHARDALTNLREVAEGAFAAATIARTTYDAPGATGVKAREAWVDAEQRFAAQLAAWRERQPRQLRLDLSAVDESRLRLVLTVAPPAGGAPPPEPRAVLELAVQDEPLSIPPLLRPAALIAGVTVVQPALANKVQLIGRHRLRVTSLDGSAEYNVRPPDADADPGQPTTFDFGNPGYPRFPAVRAGEPTGDPQPYTVTPLPPEVRGRLLAERLEPHIASLRSDIDNLLAGAEDAYLVPARAHERAALAALDAGDVDARGAALMALQQLSREWDEHIAPIEAKLDELDAMHGQLSGAQQDLVDVAALRDAIDSYRQELGRLDPGAVLQRLQTEIQRRRLQEDDPDDDEG